jgi:predicted ATPase
VQIGILGALTVERGGEQVEVAGGRLKSLLARLAVDVGCLVSATSLADAIWDGDLPGDEQHALQSLISRLRRALGAGELIQQHAGGYRLALDAEQVDASRFARLADAGAAALRDGEAQRARELLSEALALWRGPALADVVAGGSLAAAAAALQERRVGASADRAEAQLALGHAAELVGELEALAGEHPLHERLAGQLMQALYAAGRQADALAVYEQVRVRLADELGVSPSPALAQVHLSVLRGEGPAPPPGAGTNLRARLTSFVGREDELERVGELLAEQRLLSLIGAGGAGKTRLASEVAQRASASLDHRVWLVELASIADADEVAPAVLGSLGLHEVELFGTSKRIDDTDALSRLLEALGGRRTLLVLDNCEHLLEPIAALVERLLAGCPELRILCTSREPLGITGEMLMAVAPLALPAEGISVAEALAVPAVRLFADRAAAVTGGFAVEEDTVETVIEVVRRVDGLPLAIELAAARLRAMTLPQLAARLDDRFRVLTGGSRTALARQRTLRAVVDWSWDLLDEPERALLWRLSVFAGGATLEAAEEVCAGGPLAAADVFELLCALVEKSLLELVGGETPRYRMLETIREYGLERAAEASELASIRERHARHFAALAIEAERHLRAAEQLTWLARLRAEHDNVIVALRQLADRGEAALLARAVASLLWFWVLAGSRQEVLIWIELALAVPGEADPLDRLLLGSVQALARAIPGEEGPNADPWQALTDTLAQLQDAALPHHPLLAALRPLLAMGVGRGQVLELLEHSARHPDPWVRATVPFVRIQVAENEGEVEAMRTGLDEALAAFTAVGDRWGLAMTLSELSGLRILEGDLDGAERALEQTQSLLSELGAPDGGRLEMRMADILARRGDLQGAREVLCRNLREHERSPEEQAMVKTSLAALTERSGEPARARELLSEALAELDSGLARRPERGHVRAVALSTAALAELQLGELDAARGALGEAYAVATATQDMPIVAIVGVSLAALAERLGSGAQSAEILGAAAALRGAEDLTSPEIARLTSALSERLGPEGFRVAFAGGRGLERDAALARLDPERLAPSGQTRRR